MNQSDRLRSERIKRVVENIDQRLIILWLPMKLRRLTYIWKFILSMTCSVIGWTFKLKVFNETIKELKEHEYMNVCNVPSTINEWLWRWHCESLSKAQQNKSSNYRIRSINSRAYYLKTGSWKSEVRGEINRRAYGENKKAGRKQCLQCLIRTRVLFERIRYY